MIKHAPPARTPVTIKRAILSPWRLDNGLAHIGVVSDGFARDGTPLVIHNIGAGAQEEDVLFSWRMVGGTIGILLNKRSPPHEEKNSDVFYTDSFFFLTAHQRQCQHNQHNTATFNGPPDSHRATTREKEYAANGNGQCA